MRKVSQQHDLDLSSAQVRAIVTLLHKTWPGDSFDQRMERFVDQLPQQRDAHGAAPIRYVVWDEGQVIAHANTFQREIVTTNGPMTVMALAGVCVAAEHRGEGLGAEIVRRTFDRVDRREFAVSLFQTGIPDFYEKLGAKLVHNRFVNALAAVEPQAWPWRDKWVMVYPGEFDWPAGEIDIHGPAY